MEASKTTNEVEISIRQLNSLVPNKEPHTSIGVSDCIRHVQRNLGTSFFQRIVESHLMMDFSLTTNGMEMHMRKEFLELESATNADNAIDDAHNQMMMMVD